MKGVTAYVVHDGVNFTYAWPFAADSWHRVVASTDGGRIDITLDRYAAAEDMAYRSPAIAVDVVDATLDGAVYYWDLDRGKILRITADGREDFMPNPPADPATGKSERVLREETHAWVNVLGPPRFLEDGGFLWLSERTGFQHLYRYDQDGKLARPLTDGRWEVRSLLAVDEDAEAAYVSGT